MIYKLAQIYLPTLPISRLPFADFLPNFVPTFSVIHVSIITINNLYVSKFSMQTKYYWESKPDLTLSIFKITCDVTSIKGCHISWQTCNISITLWRHEQVDIFEYVKEQLVPSVLDSLSTPSNLSCDLVGDLWLFLFGL